MKYITIILLLFILACENQTKKEETFSDTGPSAKDMEVYIDEGSLVTTGDTSKIWVKRVFPGGKTDQVSTVDMRGNNRVYEFDGMASLIFFDCKLKRYIVGQIYYFLGDNSVTEVDNRRERIDDKNTWSKIEPGNYIEKVAEFVCKPEEKE